MVGKTGERTLLYALGRYDEALEAFKMSIQFCATSAAYTSLGNAFVKLKQYDKAVVSCKDGELEYQAY